MASKTKGLSNLSSVMSVSSSFLATHKILLVMMWSSQISMQMWWLL